MWTLILIIICSQICCVGCEPRQYRLNNIIYQLKEYENKLKHERTIESLIHQAENEEDYKEAQKCEFSKPDQPEKLYCTTHNGLPTLSPQHTPCDPFRNASCKGCIIRQRLFVQIEGNKTLFQVGHKYYFEMHHLYNPNGYYVSLNCTNEKQEKCDCTKNTCQGETKACQLLGELCTPSTDILVASQGELCNCTKTRINIVPVWKQGNTFARIMTYWWIPMCVSHIKEVTHNRISSITNHINYRLNRVTRELPDNFLSKSKNHEHVTFHDDLIQTNGYGQLILDKNGIQVTTIIKENGTMLHSIPQDFFLHSGPLTVYFNTPNGLETIQKYLEEKTICQRLDCLICPSLFYNLQCLPVIFKYIFYCIIGFILMCFLLYLHIIIMTLKLIFRIGKLALNISWRIIKTINRYFILLGFTSAYYIKGFFKKSTSRMESLIPILLVIFQVFSQTPFVISCDKNLAYSSNLRSCEITLNSTQTCIMESLLSLEMNRIGEHACLILTSNKHPILRVELIYKDFTCKFITYRSYFTTDYKINHIADETCSYSTECSHGRKCHSNTTYYSFHLNDAKQHWPGKLDCQMGITEFPHLLHCWANTRRCIFYYYYITPNYPHMYEVRRISEILCVPKILLKIVNLSTKEATTKVIDEAYQPEAIKSMIITITGEFQKPANSLSSLALIHSIRNISNVYLHYASPPNKPETNQIGDIQLQSLTDTKFIFSDNLYTCSVAFTTLSCKQALNPLNNLHNMAPNKLPLHHNLYFLQVDDKGQIYATTPQISPIRISLQFHDFNIRILYSKVCPEVIKIIKLSGCYTCTTPATIYFEAVSTCRDGSATAYLKTQSVTHYNSQTYNLKVTAQSFRFDFFPTMSCISDHLCMNTVGEVNCLPFSHCFDSPNLLLAQSGINYFQTSLNDSSNDLNDLQHFFTVLTHYIPILNVLDDLHLTNYIPHASTTLLLVICMLIIVFTISFAYSFIRIY